MKSTRNALNKPKTLKRTKTNQVIKTHFPENKIKQTSSRSTMYRK